MARLLRWLGLGARDSVGSTPAPDLIEVLAGSDDPRRPAAEAEAQSRPENVAHGIRPPRGWQVAIVAELSIPACKLYRVDHKAAALQRLGHRVDVVDWSDRAAAYEALQLCDLLILYRVGMHPHVRVLLDQARRLGVPTLFEADDLIFDVGVYGADPSLLSRPAWQRRSLLEGVTLYRETLLACDGAIASTEPLAAAMRDARSNAGSVFVVENAPSHDMLSLADRIRQHPLPRSADRLVMGYGSGTRTHDADMASVAPALARVLDRFPTAELVLHGALAVPDALGAFGGRIRQVPLLGYDDYLRAVATWDVNLAPLHRSAFTEAKSNIKFLEAALVEVPSVCTPTEPFRNAIEPGVNGLLADTAEDWTDALSSLLGDAGRRREMGARALATVLDRYHPDRVAENQLRPILDRLVQPSDRARVLVADAAQAEGGEGPAKRLRTAGGFDVRTFVFDEPDPARPVGAAPGLERRVAPGQDVVGFRPSTPPDPHQYWNLDVAAAFGRLAAAWRPDVVVAGDLSRLGMSILHACLDRNVPYVIMLRDEWWLRDPALSEPASACTSGATADDLRDAADRSTNPELVYHRCFELRELLLQAAALVATDDRLRAAYRSHGVPETLLRGGDLGGILRELVGPVGS